MAITAPNLLHGAERQFLDCRFDNLNQFSISQWLLVKTSLDDSAFLHLFQILMLGLQCHSRNCLLRVLLRLFVHFI